MPPAATGAAGGGGGGSGGAVEDRDLGRRMCIQDFQVGENDDDGTVFPTVGPPSQTKANVTIAQTTTNVGL